MRVSFAVAFASLSIACHTAAADTTTVYSFCSQAQCKDGSAPQAPLTLAAIGTLYGTTSAGGANGGGTVFSLIANKDGSWTRTTLYSFCRDTGCPDGAAPLGPVVVDSSGNLYGVTSRGGQNDDGVAFALSPEGRLKVLYDFPANVQPLPALTYAKQQFGEAYDGVSPLFGITQAGGLFNQGTAFQLVPPAGKKKWRQATIYSFCALEACKDGASPTALLAAGTGSGSLIGATFVGGKRDSGTVFSLFLDGRKWKEKVLHHFCTLQKCMDGSGPNSLLLGQAIIGTTGHGGNKGCGGKGCGVVFSLDPSQSFFAIGHTFCSDTDCADGYDPAGLSFGAAGTIFGVTRSGGDATFVAGGGGTLFTFDGGPFRTVKSFCSTAGCADGANPGAPPTQVDVIGTMLGTTANGGAHGDGGTIYSLSP